MVVTLEAKRVNQDRYTAIPDDYDKLAARDPEAAVWVTKNGAAGHEVLQALNSPADDQPRVEKSYSENSPPSKWRIDAPGFTELETAVTLLRDLDHASIDG